MFNNSSINERGKSNNHVIPNIIWGVVDEKMTAWKNNHKKNKNKKRSIGASNGNDVILLRKFCYNVNQEAWSAECGYTEGKNLFFEYMSNTEGKWKSKGSITDDYISVEFSNGANTRRSESRNGNGANSSTAEVNQYNYYYQTDAIRENMLRKGLKSPAGDHFELLGCSNSQVKNYTFIFRRVSKKAKKNSNESMDLLRSILPTLDELEQKKGIAKRIKYSGLLFSGVKCFVKLPKKTIIQKISSVQRHDFDFTDGTGLISIKLARYIATKMNLDSNSVPSVFQIRYGGCIYSNKHLDGTIESSTADSAYVCKGILLVDPTEEDKYVISFRASMLKVPLAEGSTVTNDWAKHMNDKLGIVDFSQNKIGKLNQQAICLLSANVPHQDLRSIQNFHLDQIRNSWRDPFALGYLSALEAANSDDRNWDFFEQIILQSDTAVYQHKRLPSAYISLTQKKIQVL